MRPFAISTAAQWRSQKFSIGVHQSVAFLSVHSRSAALTKILAHPLGFTRRPLPKTPRNHIPKKLCIFLKGGAYAPSPLVWLRHWSVVVISEGGRGEGRASDRSADVRALLQ